MHTNRSLLPTALALLLPLHPLAYAAETVWLSSLDLTYVVQGWGQPHADKSVTGQPLSIGGRRFQHGVGTHAEGMIRLELNGGSEKFSAYVGVDDDTTNAPASISFKIVGDGKTLWKTGVMRSGQPAERVELDVKGLKSLLLLVDTAGDGGTYDHADWADAQFQVTGQRPAIVRPPAEPAVVLTPPPPSTPRINGARIFGVRPGHPFLFTIPATGDRPMTFAVKDLPAGLAVDPKTGQITGKIEKPGEYLVTFQASNALGMAERPFKIVCGPTLALTPHMGWNSWYVWEGRVTDRILREAADAMVNSGLIHHGYQYINIDDCWSIKPNATDPSLSGAPRDSNGMVNSNPRFPDMKALTDYIHARGLKAGIYTSPGPLTCAGHVGAYEHEELDARRFAEWGFDFLKYDWCSYGRIDTNHTLAAFQKPYRLMGQILQRLDRDIVLNLCQYGMGDVWKWGQEVGGHSWRTAGDLGGSFQGIPAALFRDGFDLFARQELHRFSRPGAWNDPDYLLLGYLSNWRGSTALTPLTPNEQYSHVSLWCLLAAPLIFSGDLTRLDAFTLSLLTNDEVLDVDQDPLGNAARRVARNQDCEVWAKEMEDGSKAVGLFNRGEHETVVGVAWADLGFQGKRAVRDLWRQKDLGTFDGRYETSVPRHGVVLIRCR